MAAFSSFQQHHPFSSSISLPNSTTATINNKLLDQPNNNISQFNEDHSSSIFSVTTTTTTNNNISMDSSSIVTDKYQKNPPSMPKKRKSKQPSSPNSAQSKDMRDQENKGKRQKKVKACEEKNKSKEEEPKGYIHVRARRGQATDSHSLAERVRRERISERMKLLQALVPGCDKVTGKALMLDEIINYVQSLQNQVEFLSMKLASVNPMIYDFGMDLEPFMFRPDQNLNSLPSQLPPMQQSCSPTTANLYPIMDVNSANSLLFQQSQILNSLPDQDQRQMLWEVEDQRQKFINQSEISNNSLFSFH
ncbi:hypothetical protein CDL12_29462 [Handroanthus impetiginosus]|uniref:BHLH domain-containing protein n=1 Tax=Handroanthus impetiginosus TaxID=429701 RepID=A0A2G9FYC1_9LAMI|nr:hypothetical protein CDL12_29462 [Handroanthus impetiginosus]